MLPGKREKAGRTVRTAGSCYRLLQKGREARNCGALRVSLYQRVNSKSQCSDYIISRAFIPPWSLVMTRPETLGPDASIAEAGTLVSSDQFQLRCIDVSHVISEFEMPTEKVKTPIQVQPPT